MFSRFYGETIGARFLKIQSTSEAENPKLKKPSRYFRKTSGNLGFLEKLRISKGLEYVLY
jgi:hypothetical protein